MGGFLGIKVSTNPAYSRSAGIRDLHDDDDGRVAVEAAGHAGASSGAAGMARLVRARQCWSWVVLSLGPFEPRRGAVLAALALGVL